MEIVPLVLNNFFKPNFFLQCNHKHQEIYLKKLIKPNKTTIKNIKKERENEKIVTLFPFKLTKGTILKGKKVEIFFFFF